MSPFVQRGGLWVLAQNGLMLLALLVASFGPRENWPRPIWFLGLGLLLLGAALGVAGARALGRNLTPYPKPRERSELVHTGIYGLIRHPLYTCLICATLGWALAWSSAWGAGLGVLLAVVLDAKARREEHWLKEKFPEYPDYIRRTRRFVPGLY